MNLGPQLQGDHRLAGLPGGSTLKFSLYKGLSSFRTSTSERLIKWEKAGKLGRRVSGRRFGVLGVFLLCSLFFFSLGKFDCK